MTRIRTFLWATGVLTLMSGVFVANAHLPGRMTGGGSVKPSIDSATFDNLDRITHGFEIHCGGDTGSGNTGSDNNNLEINWGAAGDKHKFKLDKHLSWAHCDYVPELGPPNPPAAGFNWFHGRGAGLVDNTKAAGSIDFIFTDSGEPGGDNGPDPDDTALYCISSGPNADLFTPASCDVLFVATTVTYQFDNGITPNLITYPGGLPLRRGNHQAHAQ